MHIFSKLAGAAVLAITTSQTAQAQSQRGDNWEVAIGAISNSSESSDGEMGSSLDIERDTGLNLSVYYNFNSQWALGFDGAFLRPKYTAVFNTEEDGLVQVKHTMNVFSGQFNGTWNMIDGPITPYLQAGLGWTYVDSNVADGPPTTGCWWDPWWGYVCRNFYSTYNDTRFSYGVGAGLRWEFRNGMFLKGSYNLVQMDDNTDADPSFDTAKFELGWIF